MAKDATAADNDTIREICKVTLAFCLGWFFRNTWLPQVVTAATPAATAPRNDEDFVIADDLQAGKVEVAQWQLCKVLLVDDANYPGWLVLVPKQKDLREVTDLAAEDQRVLWEEVARAGGVIQEAFKPAKLNVAAIGNVCPQLHVHVTGRSRTDPAWPQPCYGAVPPKPYPADKLRELTQERLPHLLA